MQGCTSTLDIGHRPIEFCLCDFSVERTNVPLLPCQEVIVRLLFYLFIYIVTGCVCVVCLYVGFTPKFDVTGCSPEIR